MPSAPGNPDSRLSRGDLVGACQPERQAQITKTKGLDNLLWVYSPNHGEKTAAYYAGDRYVDLVGLDAYTDFVDQGHIKGYAEVEKLEPDRARRGLSFRTRWRSSGHGAGTTA